MTDPTYVHVTAVVDASDTQHARAASLKAREVVATLVQGYPRHTVTLVRFAAEPRTDARLQEGPVAWEFDPAGENGAVLDALGAEIHRTGSDLSTLPEEARPGAVHVVVAAGGTDRASSEYDLPTVRALVEHQRDVYGWAFHFVVGEG